MAYTHMKGQTMKYGHILDVGNILGICQPVTTRVWPPRYEDEILVRIGEDMSFLQLRGLPATKALLAHQDWYIYQEWAHTKIPAGDYTLNFGSSQEHRLTFWEQEAQMYWGKPAPAVIVALGMMCLRTLKLEDKLQFLTCSSIRCAEETAGAGRHYHVSLRWTTEGVIQLGQCYDFYKSTNILMAVTIHPRDTQSAS